MKIMKFGGTSVGDADRIKEACRIITEHGGKNPIVVVSAVGGITDKLIACAGCAESGSNPDNDFREVFEKHHIIAEELGIPKDDILPILEMFSDRVREIRTSGKCSDAVFDELQSIGERLSSHLVAGCFTLMGVKAKRYAAYDVGMLTEDTHGGADVLPESYESLNKNLKGLDHIAIITGFIGKSKKGDITTLGRGGSDYTAAIIGSAIGAEEIQIWTDVDGIKRTDPRVIKDAKTIAKLSFKEAAELAYFGAKVLHPKTILPAMEKDIPVRVLNTHNPTHPGTIIVRECAAPKSGVRAIAFKKDVVTVNINSTRMLAAYGFLEKVFAVFAEAAIVVDMISTSEVSLSLTIENVYPESLLKSVKDRLSEMGTITFDKEKSIVSLVGQDFGKGMKKLGDVFSTVGSAGIEVEMVSAGASSTNISFVVKEKDVGGCVKVLHDKFFM